MAIDEILTRIKDSIIQNRFEWDVLYAMSSSLSGLLEFWSEYSPKSFRKFDLLDYRDKSKLILVTEFI